MSLENLMPLKQYVPAIYEGVKEIEVLTDTQEQWFQILISVLDKEYARMFIQTSDEIGVQRFESLLKITANPKIESLQFRKERLLTRSNITLPYSTIWLRAYLNAVIGEHNYELNIDYDNDIMTLYGYLLDYSWARECSLVIRDTKPCNMVFINIPTIIDSVGLMSWWDSNTWQGSSWDDNNIWYDYALLQSEQLIDYEQQKQATPTFQQLLNTITSVTLNNCHTLQITPTVENDIIYIQITVPEDITLLENVKIIDGQGATLVSTDCYIDTPSGTQIVLRLSCYKGKEI
jgi:hypothetical protein